jgi:hypothetical protein
LNSERGVSDIGIYHTQVCPLFLLPGGLEVRRKKPENLSNGAKKAKVSGLDNN